MPLRRNWRPKPCGSRLRTCSELGCVDDIVPEPEGGAHRDHEAAANLLDVSLQKHLAELKKLARAELVASRYNKFRTIAQFFKTE